ncbi:SIMPL domain-containing protein [Myxococcaceae bacterium GXIMD 01537]
MKTTRLLAALTLLASLSGAAALAQTKVAAPPAIPSVESGARTLRVEGTGETKAQPDEAYLELAVETVAPTAKAAGEENARKMEKVLAALTGAGIAKKDIDTRNYNVFPEYAPPPPNGTEPKLKGYRVQNMVSVHVTDLARVGTLLDKALAAGVNRVDNVRFALSRQDAVQGEALRQAVQRARNSAQVLASALGVKLGPVLDASTVSEPPRFYAARMSMMESADKSATTSINPEEQTITAKVTLIFAIE